MVKNYEEWMELVRRRIEGDVPEKEKKMVVFKWKSQPLLKKCKTIKVETLKDNIKRKKGTITNWHYQPRFEEVLFKEEKEGNLKILGFFDKEEQEIKVDFEELRKYDYVKIQRPELNNKIIKEKPKEIKKLTDVEIVKEFSIGRLDFYWLYDEKGIPKHVKKHLTDELIEQHIKGEVVLGSSPFIDNEYVRYGVIDIDAHILDDMSEEQKEQTLKVAKEDFEKLKEYFVKNVVKIY